MEEEKKEKRGGKVIKTSINISWKKGRKQANKKNTTDRYEERKQKRKNRKQGKDEDRIGNGRPGEG